MHMSPDLTLDHLNKCVTMMVLVVILSLEELAVVCFLLWLGALTIHDNQVDFCGNNIHRERCLCGRRNCTLANCQICIYVFHT